MSKLQVKQVMKKKRAVESPDITCEESSDVESLYYEAKPKKKSKKRKGCNHNEDKENMKVKPCVLPFYDLFSLRNVHILLFSLSCIQPEWLVRLNP